MIIVDSHCHLNYDAFTEDGIPAVLQRAADVDVKYAQTICTKIADFPVIHKMALDNKNLFCSYGIHPHNAGDDIVSIEDIIENASKDKVIGIGETGLDYFYEYAPKDAQITSFKHHLEAARQLDMPVIIHTRDAEDDTMKILDEALAKGPLKLLFHCFSSSPRLAEYAIEKGIYLSASGIITFKKSDDVREGFAKAPLELLMVETDAPYLAPVPHRGKSNEPAYTRHVAEKLAEIKEVSIEEIAEITTNNFFSLFNKAIR